MIKKKWCGKTGGALWMQRSLIIIYKTVGLRPMYAAMAFVILFYMLFGRKSYLATYSFFRKRMLYGRVKSFVNVYRNHYVFGQIVIDRFAAYAGKRFNLHMDGNDTFLAMADGKDGFVMLSSHVGNYEMAGYTLESGKKPFKALVYGGETSTVTENRVRLLGNNRISLVPIADDMSHVFILNDALASGEIVSMSGDRFVDTKTVCCSFFGEKAKFPAGPFVLAVLRKVKVSAVFVMKESVNDYHVYIREIPSGGGTTRERVRSLAQSFANGLESIVRQYPVQWFNYYNFWER